MKVSSQDYSTWKYICLKRGSTHVQSEHDRDPDFLYVYLVKKDKFKDRWVLPLVKIKKDSALFQKIINEAGAIHKKIKANNKGNIFRSVSLMVATSLLSEELSPLKIKKESLIQSSNLWVRSKSRDSDLVVLSNKKVIFDPQRIKTLSDFKEAALFYPFNGIKINYPPDSKSVPKKLLDVLPRIKRTSKKKKAPQTINKTQSTKTAVLVIEDEAKGYVYFNSEKYDLTTKQIDLIRFMQEKNPTFPHRVSIEDLIVLYNDKYEAHKWTDKFRGKNGKTIQDLVLNRSIKKYLELRIPIQTSFNVAENA